MRDYEPSPFNPGFGRRPAVFGGHEQALTDLTRALETHDLGENQALLISGLRGAGKTSMLSVLQERATERGWAVIADDASEGLVERVSKSTIPRILNQLEGSSEFRLKAVQVAQVKAEMEITERPVVPLLRHQLIDLSAALGTRGGVLITIDEVTSSRAHLQELTRFALEVQHAINAGAVLMVAFAGIGVDLDELMKQRTLTFLRRSRPLDFRRLPASTTRRVLQETIEFGGRTTDDAALDRLTQIAQGYPYLIQLAGDYAWRHTPGSPTVTLADADFALDRAIKAVVDRVISRVFDDLSERDKDFLRAMSIDEGRSKMADIVQRMGESDQYVQVYKQRLIKSGYVQQAGRGYVEFSLPYLDQYIKTLTGDGPEARPANEGWDSYPPPAIG
ncbi:ATP-binding protein [Mariniluteicoccus endophyticus]